MKKIEIDKIQLTSEEVVNIVLDHLAKEDITVRKSTHKILYKEEWEPGDIESTTVFNGIELETRNEMVI
jgi:hypothetical protein